MKKLLQIKKILQKNKSFLAEKYSVGSLGVFGSYTRNNPTPQSDLDILVEFTQPVSFFQFLELEDHLSELLKIKVDLVSKKALKPRIGKYILQEVIFI